MRLLESILSEDKVDFITKSMGDKIMMAFKKDIHPEEPEIEAKEVVQRLANDVSKKHLQAVAKWYANGDFKLEDMARIKSELNQFDAIKGRLEPAERDINRYKSSAEVFQLISRYSNDDTRSNKEAVREIKKGAKRYYEDENLLIVTPKTEEAACYYGKGTRWCTAATGGYNYFDQYSKDGPLYVIMIKGSNTKYQFHFESRQFMNAEDRHVDLTELISKYPSLKDAFSKQGEKFKIFQLLKNPTTKQIAGRLRRYPQEIKHYGQKEAYVDAALSSKHANEYSVKQIKGLSSQKIRHYMKKYPHNADAILLGWNDKHADKSDKSELARSFLKEKPELIAIVEDPSKEEIVQALKSNVTLWQTIVKHDSKPDKAFVITTALKITMNKLRPDEMSDDDYYDDYYDYDRYDDDDYYDDHSPAEYDYDDIDQPQQIKQEPEEDINYANVLFSLWSSIENVEGLSDSINNLLMQSINIAINATDDYQSLKAIYNRLPKKFQMSSKLARQFIDADTNSLKFLPTSRALQQYANAIIDDEEP